MSVNVVIRRLLSEVTVWRRDGNIYMTAKSLPEDLLGRGQQPWIAATANGTCIVWTSEREGDLMLPAPSSQHAKNWRKRPRPDGCLISEWESTCCLLLGS